MSPWQTVGVGLAVLGLVLIIGAQFLPRSRRWRPMLAGLACEVAGLATSWIGGAGAATG